MPKVKQIDWSFQKQFNETTSSGQAKPKRSTKFYNTSQAANKKRHRTKMKDKNLISEAISNTYRFKDIMANDKL